MNWLTNEFGASCIALYSDWQYFVLLQERKQLHTSSRLLEFSKEIARAARGLALLPEDIYTRFILLMKKFDGVFAQLDMPCSDGMPSYCWLVEHLERWNNLMNPIGTEMVQVTEDKVCLRTLLQDIKHLKSSVDFSTAVCLLLWVLKQHRCIAFVTLQFEGISSKPVYPLYNALSFQLGYKYIRLISSLNFLDYQTSETFLIKLRNQNQLVHLELGGFRFSDRLGTHLCNLLMDNPCLKEFVLSSVIDDIESANRLFRAISVHTSLRTLKLRFLPLMDPAVCESLISLPLQSSTIKEFSLKINCRYIYLYEALAKNTSLSKLIVTTSVNTIYCLICLASSMAANTTLKSLKIIMGKGVPLGVEHCKLLADVIEKNAGLEELNLKHCSLPYLFARYMSTALGHNRTLKKLEVAGKNMSTDDLNLILKALQRNSTIRQICLGAVDNLTEEGFQRIWLSDSFDRLSVHYTDNAIAPLALAAERGLRLSEVHVTCSQPKAPVLNNVLVNSFETLTSLFLEVRGGLDMPAAKPLSNLFVIGSSLRSVVLGFNTTSEVSQLLMEGLAKNQSISIFELDGWCLDSRAVEALVQMLTKNKSINNLTVRQVSINDLNILNSQIHRGINLNHTLVTLNVLAGYPSKTFVNPSVLPAIRRNERLVNLVSDCIISNNFSGERLLELQRIHSSNALVLKLQEKAECSRDEAVQKVHRALHGLGG